MLISRKRRRVAAVVAVDVVATAVAKLAIARTGEVVDAAVAV